VDTLACEFEAHDAPTAAATDFEAFFRANYQPVARVIARVVRDHARAEELAVEIFLKVWKIPRLHREVNEGWLYRAAVRKGLDELRRQNRRTHYERLLGFVRHAKNPEEIHLANEEQNRIRGVLAALKPRQAELLLLQSHGLSYRELAAALNWNPASMGTLLRRAQDEFRRRYVKLYGNQ
jgi:RNA polymerase sigma-70 factor (ECF subfamily)